MISAECNCVAVGAKSDVRYCIFIISFIVDETIFALRKLFHVGMFCCNFDQISDVTTVTEKRKWKH